ncbi:MAG: FAD-binding protein [Deltaproteobacteria bacterium]|nr:FAD-binding protein [Deltaproteobacteria bacterium]
MTAHMDRFAAAVEHHLGQKAVVTQPERLERLAVDESGEGPYPPLAAIYPTTPDQARACLALASEFRVPVTPRGAGTGKSGGALAVQGGVILGTERMARILDIDEADMVAVVEPGVITSVLQEEVESRGLFYPPDPSSLESCTIGGNLAENAGGPRAMKYGVTRRFILGAEVSLMDGTKMELGGRNLKDVSGYDLTSLMVGSEGTLALATRLQLRLLARPRTVGAVWASFPTFEAAGRAVSALLRSGLDLRCLELIDHASLTYGVLETSGLAAQGKAALLAEMDGWEEDMTPRLAEAGQVCEREGAVDVNLALDAASLRRLWSGRRHLSDALKKSHPHKLSEDVTVPVGRVGQMMSEAWAIGTRHDIEVAVYGHAGDGNLHVNFLPHSAGERQTVEQTAAAELIKTALDLGGTLSGEHGVGLTKRAWMVLRHGPEELSMMRRIKASWDPVGLLNPGKLLPSP